MALVPVYVSVMISETAVSVWTQMYVLTVMNAVLYSTQGLSPVQPCIWGGSVAARLLGLCVRIPQWAWISVSCECCVLSGRGLCVWLITRPEESYRIWSVWMWSWSLDMGEALAPGGCCTMKYQLCVVKCEWIGPDELSEVIGWWQWRQMAAFG
jgi:hypothetical protein